MKTTPFTEKHIALGAKMHEFAGYNMPIEYSGIIDEHITVCQGAGVFVCLLYTSPSPRDTERSRMPSSA